jgi:hypothetical protein
MAPCFFDLPLELREIIYFELLVIAVPIPLEPDGVNPCPLRGSRRRGLCPAILRVNKKTYREASPLLYSKNRFEIPYYAIPGLTFPETNQIALFLTQIGRQASLIRQIYIDFPHWDFDHPHATSFRPEQIRDLELVRASCQDIRVLELSLDTTQIEILEETVSPETLDSIDGTIRDILSPKEIKVRVESYGEVDIRDSVIRMRSYGWAVEVTRQERFMDTWYHDASIIKLEYRDDYYNFVNMLSRVQERKDRLEDY